VELKDTDIRDISRELVTKREKRPKMTNEERDGQRRLNIDV
jgi:hypothetical protein